MSETSQPHASELELHNQHLRDLVLAPISLNPDYQTGDFTYDAALHGLTLPGSSPDTFRLAFFRAVGASEDSQLVNRSPENAVAANIQYGLGLYGGNSTESVAHFAWRGDRTVKLFLTPEIAKEDVIDVSYEDTSQALKQFLASKKAVMRNKEAAQHESQLVEKYQDKKLVIMSKPIDVKISQRLQSGPQEYPINPQWYIWRGPVDDFEPIGEARYFPTQRKLAKLVVDKIVAISQNKDERS